MNSDQISTRCPDTPGANGKHKRIDAIDGLRAIAVIGVIIYHLYPPALPGGFVGVDVFFLISGYVVCRSLLKTPCDSFPGFVSAFYTRRLLRIYPALIFMLLVVGVLSRLFIPDSWLLGASHRTGLFAFFGLSNIHLVRATNGYFTPNAAFNPYIHTWSLAVEEQFYVLFPVILYIYLRSQRLRKPGASKLAGLFLASLFAFSLLFSIWETKHRPDFAYYLLTSRFWELALGAILCLAHHRNRFLQLSSVQTTVLVFVGLGCIAVSTIFTSLNLFPFPWAIVPVVGTACCIAGVVVPSCHNPGSKFLSLPPVAYMGRISYSLYLWHWPVIVLMKWTIGIESALAFGIAALLTVALGSLSFHFVEKSFQVPGLFQATWRRIVAAVTGNGGDNVKTGPSFSFNVAVVTACMAAIVLSSLVFMRVSRSETLPLSVTMKSGTGHNAWALSSPGITNRMLNPGEAGKPWNGKTLFVIGDSHAGAYAEMLDLLRKERGCSVYLNSEGGAHIGSLLQSRREVDRAVEASMLVDIKRYAKPGDVVMLASLRVLRLGDPWANLDLREVVEQRDSEQAEMDRKLAVKEGRELIRTLEALGLVVLIDAPKPVFFSPPFRCSDWFNEMNPIGRHGFSLSRDFLLEHRSAAMRSIEEVSRECANVRVWDPFWVFCKGDTCSAFEGQNPLFFDSDHLSSYGNRRLYPDFVSNLERIWSNLSSNEQNH